MPTKGKGNLRPKIQDMSVNKAETFMANLINIIADFREYYPMPNADMSKPHTRVNAYLRQLENIAVLPDQTESEPHPERLPPTPSHIWFALERLWSSTHWLDRIYTRDGLHQLMQILDKLLRTFNPHDLIALEQKERLILQVNAREDKYKSIEITKDKNYLLAENSRLNKEIVTLQGEVDDEALATAKETEKKLDALQKNAGLSKEIAQLKSAFENVNQALSVAQHKSIAQDYLYIQSKFEALLAQHTQLQHENSQLLAENKQLQQENNLLRETIQALSSELKIFHERCYHYQNDIKQLQQESLITQQWIRACQTSGDIVTTDISLPTTEFKNIDKKQSTITQFFLTKSKKEALQSTSEAAAFSSAEQLIRQKPLPKPPKRLVNS